MYISFVKIIYVLILFVRYNLENKN